jgi:hypothetical protein
MNTDNTALSCATKVEQISNNTKLGHHTYIVLMNRFLRCCLLIQDFHQSSLGAVVHSVAMHRAVQVVAGSVS